MRELQRRWTWKELVLAHEMLDAIEDAEEQAARDARKAARREDAS